MLFLVYDLLLICENIVVETVRGLGIAAKVFLISLWSEHTYHVVLSKRVSAHPRVLSLDCMWSSLGISLCLNIVFLIVVVDYFEVVLTHTGPLAFFKSISQYDSIIYTSWKKAYETLQYRLEKKLIWMNFESSVIQSTKRLLLLTALTLGPPGF